MNILAIGDIVGKNGTEFLRLKLRNIKSKYGIDLVIANGENSAEGNGITPDSARRIFDSGVDVITNGNHTFRRREIFTFLNENHKILRPCNYPCEKTPGVGIYKLNVKDIKVAVINLMGTVYLENLICPFKALDEALETCSDCQVKVVDFHAEATAEKRALAFYADGRVSAFFGTHTHVQTSDEEILPGGTGYITDVGMTGPINSVLGVKKELSIKRLKDKLPVRFENAGGLSKMECIIFNVNEQTGKTNSVNRLRIC